MENHQVIIMVILPLVLKRKKSLGLDTEREGRERRERSKRRKNGEEKEKKKGKREKL